MIVNKLDSIAYRFNGMISMARFLFSDFAINLINFKNNKVFLSFLFCFNTQTIQFLPRLGGGSIYQ